MKSERFITRVLILSQEVPGVRPEKFQFLEKGQNRNFG